MFDFERTRLACLLIRSTCEFFPDDIVTVTKDMAFLFVTVQRRGTDIKYEACRAFAYEALQGAIVPESIIKEHLDAMKKELWEASGQ